MASVAISAISARISPPTMTVRINALLHELGPSTASPLCPESRLQARSIESAEAAAASPRRHIVIYARGGVTVPRGFCATGLCATMRTGRRAGSDESTNWLVALHDLDLGAPRDHRNYVPRGGSRFCGASLRRRHRFAPRAPHPPSAEA